MASLNMRFSRLVLRQAAFRPLSPRILQPNTSQYTQQTRLQSTVSRAIPRFAQASLWQSMVPKFLRNRGGQASGTESPKSKEWNPASFYIIIFILIGSQAIRMIALKNDYAAYSRTADAKILLLREVIGRVKAGEKVDLERLLGTGDEGKEREWEEVLREIEDEDSLWHRKPKDEAKQAESQSEQEQTEQSRMKDTAVPAEGSANEEPPTDGASRRKLNFF
ncbi:hypothetical protein FE257_004549 [Aspergillus nanangensis]|uniref:Uncharacterized protein n=1 Tax=Aspergillus nanangensis TaxID=2582783 RepID=A0AAD4GZC3_ASPNN|nr:hypothetical protein FE257_004549 [Aspergillus nanangensis]